MEMLNAINETADKEQIARMEAIKKANEQLKQLDEIEAKKAESNMSEENSEKEEISVE
jgi:ribosomal protein L14E/L6E/L27E